MNKILLKALRCFIMSDKLLCGKNSDKKRLSLYHHIKNILIRSWEYSWFKQILALYICSCILSHEVVRYLTKINLYNLMWKVFRWSQILRRINPTQWGRKFLTSWLFFVLLWSYQSRDQILVTLLSSSSDTSAIPWRLKITDGSEIFF